MFTYPNIDPVALQIGFVKVHWYGLMYLIGIVAGWLLLRRRAKKPASGWTTLEIDDLVFYAALGVIIGGRLGSMLFYSLGDWLNDPLLIIRIWDGGMSFHGGLLGVLCALWIFARRRRRTWFHVIEFLGPVVPIGLGAGRIGNFINGELWGKPTSPDSFWAWNVKGQYLHASQLYEAFLEGLVLFLILWIFSARPRPEKAVAGLFMLSYGVFRFVVEFVRVPDEGKYVAFDWLTRGQVLTAPMILIGIWWLVLAYRGNHNATEVTRP